jgi:hypothetical protein
MNKKDRDVVLCRETHLVGGKSSLEPMWSLPFPLRLSLSESGGMFGIFPQFLRRSSMLSSANWSLKICHIALSIKNLSTLLCIRPSTS